MQISMKSRLTLYPGGSRVSPGVIANGFALNSGSIKSLSGNECHCPVTFAIVVFLAANTELGLIWENRGVTL